MRKRNVISNGSGNWSHMFKGYKGNTCIDGESLKGLCTDCGWAAVQLDYDESEEPWFAVYGTMPILLEVQRTMREGLNYGLFMCGLGLEAQVIIFSDHFGVVQTLRSGEIPCVRRKDDAGWQKPSWEKRQHQRPEGY